MSTQTVGTVPEWTMGDRLRKAREAAGFDQVDLAELIGVSRTTVSNHEVGVGKRGPSRLLLRAWAHETGVPVWWLEGQPGPSDGTSLSDTELMQYRYSWHAPTDGPVPALKVAA